MAFIKLLTQLLLPGLGRLARVCLVVKAEWRVNKGWRTNVTRHAGASPPYKVNAAA